MTKVVFLEIRPFEKEYIKQNIPVTVNYCLYKETIEQTDKDNLKDAEIISLSTESPVNEETLKGLDKVRMINTRSAGYDHIDLEYCKNHNIAVTYLPAYAQKSVGVFTMGLIIDLIRNITIANSDFKTGNLDYDKYLGKDLEGKTLGIIGTGSIGCYVAKLAHAFEMKLLAFDPRQNQEIINNYGVQYVSLDDLYKNSDIISLHAPYTGKNYHMVNEEAFNKMKDGVIIVNTARGELIDTNALLKALEDKKIGGVGIDVLESEEIMLRERKYALEANDVDKKALADTLMNETMINMPNVIVTPHCAYETIEAVYKSLDLTMDDIKSYLNQNIVNRAA
jgi:D-lactate dehydrogenase